MAEYVYIDNYTRNGTIGISHYVFDQIASIATDNVKGAAVANSRKKGLFKLMHPISCSIRNGKVDVKIDVTIQKNVNIHDICLNIQKEVASALSSMTELVPFNIDIKVVSIIK